MNILLMSATSRIAGIIAQQLRADGHRPLLTDVVGNGDIVPNELGHGQETDALVTQLDAIIHIGYGGFASGDANAMIDFHTRRAYNLLWAASDAGVPLVINVSTLQLMDAYEENLVVTENWKPLPDAGDVAVLSAHLCEIVFKEFARDGKLKILNLRLGWPIVDGGRNAANASGIHSAVCADDIGAAINAAISAPAIAQWQDVHVQSPVPRQRYTTAKAAQVLGLNI